MSLILSGTDGLSDVDGSAATPAIRGTDTNTGIFFPAADTIAFAEGGAEVARFDSSGSLGIGTTSPTFNGFSTASKGLEIKSSDTYGVLKVGGATGEFYVGSGSSSSAWVWNQSNSPMIFATNGTDRMRIDSSGNVLIGATSLTYNEKLKVAAGGAGINTAFIQFTTTDDRDVMIIRHARGVSGSSAGMINFQNAAGSQVGSIYTLNGSSTVYGTSSDYRLKENIAPMTGALDVVGQLKPCTYTWKADGSKSQGFIAHELQEVCPDAVVGEKDAVHEDGSIRPQGIDTSFLVATLTAAIQEQQAIITDLRLRIAALESK